MNPQIRYEFVAVKEGKEVSRCMASDTLDPRKAAYRRFKRMGVDFDNVIFAPKKEEK